MRLLRISIVSLSLTWACNLFAQPIVSPEECILDTLKQAGTNNSAGMVRFNCVRKYIRAAESQAVSQDFRYFPGATLAEPASRIVSRNELELKIKNNSPSTILVVYLGIINRDTKEVEIHKMYADYPVEQFTTGVFTADFLPDVGRGDYWQKHTWTFSRIMGIPVKR